jgi:hypothetical protein
VPILAHGYNSNGAGKGYGQRASPTYWRNAIEFVRTSASLPPERRRLRLCLAHYGGFDAHAPGSTCIDLGWTQKTWELIFSGLIAGPSGEFVFADLSYLSILLEDTAEAKACRGRLAKLLKEHYVAQRDPECRHLVFGSDWIMLGKERNHAEYHDRLARFLRREAGLGDAQLANIFRRNAMRLFALGPGGQGRQRLESFYGGEAAALVADLDAMA